MGGHPLLCTETWSRSNLRTQCEDCRIDWSQKNVRTWPRRPRSNISRHSPNSLTKNQNTNKNNDNISCLCMFMFFSLIFPVNVWNEWQLSSFFKQYNVSGLKLHHFSPRQNIVLDRNYNAKIIDFGSARFGLQGFVHWALLVWSTLITANWRGRTALVK